MKSKTIILILFSIFLFQSCNSYQYIYDEESKKRQHELQNNRAGNACGDIFLTLGSIFFEAATGVYVGYMPEGQEFKRIKLKNPTPDTMFVNMVTDLSWDNENYCDFWDIRIPPNDKCRLLLPMYANYNIYFGTSDNPEDDQLIEINTTNIRKINLIPLEIIDIDTSNTNSIQ